MTLRVHHVAVVVADLERSERFYSGVLGLSVVRRWDDEAGRPRSVWVALGEDAILAIERAGAAGPTRDDAAPGFHCLALAISTDEREAYRARLRAHGVEIERESAFTLYVRDPDHTLVGLSHYPHPASAR